MGFFKRSYHPIEQVDFKMRSLLAAWKKTSGLRSQRFFLTYKLEKDFNLLRWAVHDEIKAWSVDGETSIVETESIVGYFGRFDGELGRVYLKLAKSNPKMADDKLREVAAGAKRLGGAIKGLHQDVKSRRVRVAEHHTTFPEEFFKIREAMAWISPSAAEDLKGEMVDPWCEWPGLYAEEPRQVESIAKLILISRQPGQYYELRCRSSTPGRPLKSIRRYYNFPTVDEVMRVAELLDFQEKLYLTAAKPTWRIIWTFDRDTVGW